MGVIPASRAAIGLPGARALATRKRRKPPAPAPAAKKREMKLGSLQVGWLIAFVESADHKRTAAAATLGVSQSTVTKYIDSLESWYGGGPCRILMQSNVHPPVLTEAGKEFLPKARELLVLIRAALPPPVVTAAPITRGSSTAHLKVPPPVASVGEGDGTISEADRDRPVQTGSPTPAQSSSSDDEVPNGKVRDLTA